MTHIETELEAALADLRWLLTSSNILDPRWAKDEQIQLSQPWSDTEASALCQTIAGDPRRRDDLLEQLRDPSSGSRLGRRAEVLLGFAYATMGQLRRAGLVLYGDHDRVDTVHGPGRQTLGELDFILGYGDPEQCYHQELTVKVYLYDPELAPPDPGAGWRAQYAAFIGPRRKDNLAKKLARLVDHQLPLAWRPDCRTHLEAVGLKPAASSLRIPGHIFYPESVSGHDLPLPLAPAITGAQLKWWRKSVFLARLGARFHAGEISAVTTLAQQHWMGERPPASQSTAAHVLGQLRAMEAPQMLVLHGPSKAPVPPERCFVVPDDWGRST